MRPFAYRLALPGLLACALVSLAPHQAQARRGWDSPRPVPETVAADCDNQGFLAQQKDFENGGHKASVPVHICGTVLSVAHTAKETRSGLHGYFYLAVTPSISIRIVTNLDEMHTPDWPWVKKGDQVEVVGRYYYDSPRKQGVDWTHHGTGRSWHIPGYVRVNGTKYD